jgi:uncharacterized MnhB-related membrane protein
MQLAEIVRIILLILLIGCAVAVNLTPSLLQAVIIFMSYSSIMCVLWVLMESPDLAITEAAVGAGISGILFMVTLKKIRREDEAEPGEVGDVPLEELLLREEFRSVRESVPGYTDLRGRRMEKVHKRNRGARKTASTEPSKTDSARMDMSSDGPERGKSSRTPKKKGGAKSRGKRGRR